MRLQVNGVCYNIERQGEGSPTLLLHGFTGSIETWHTHFPAFVRFGEVIAVDLLGHGKSDAPPAPARYSMEYCVEDLEAILDELDIARATVLGYSMGGREALAFAHRFPERVNVLILESTSPGIENAAEREQRRRSDAELADRIERQGIAMFVEEWSNLPLFASQAQLPESVRENLKRQRLENNAQGLANSLRGLGVGAQESYWNGLPKLGVPTLLLAGALDAKYAGIAGRMSRAMPNARAEIVEDAGHMVHLEQPHVFDALITQFLDNRK